MYKLEKLAGNRALFLSRTSSFALDTPETVGCMSNCVYFISHRYCSRCGKISDYIWGVYSLLDEKVLFECTFHAGTKKQTTVLWFQTSLV